jgi:hypothetical protein
MKTPPNAPDRRPAAHVTHPEALGARDARGEARAVVGADLDPRVLEPSPPAVLDELFADDPVAPGTGARPIICPVDGGFVRWETWLHDHPEHRDWALARWLAPGRRLPAAPPEVPRTRVALHRLAAYVLSPARRRVNGKLALRWTYGGFGTPFFGADEQVRYSVGHVVRQRGGGAAAEAVTSLAQAARFVLDGPPDLSWGKAFDLPPPGDLTAPLEIEPTSAAFLADWMGFAWSVLETVRAEPSSSDPSRLQLWPEHFDAAFDALTGPQRAGFGASPGDSVVAEPYLYVLPQDPDAVAGDPLWDAEHFRGAILPWSALRGAEDQHHAALAFFHDCRAALTA